MKTRLLIFLLLQFILTAQIYPQEIGIIIGKAEANQLFGEVQSYVELDLNTAKSLLNSAGQFIMFSIVNDRLIVLDENRNVIYPFSSDVIVNNTDVYHKYSVSKYGELLEKEPNPDSSENVKFELRSEVFSITYGESTLEFSMGCPPNC